MGISQYDPAAAGRPAWNAGRQVGAKRALKIRQIWSIRFFLDREGRM
ncbi:MAG TPA: integrase, partial [Devosia sp.]|nr:integrase [Devosia sp.]